MKKKQIARAALEHDVAKFLAAGGEIQAVPVGLSGQRLDGKKRTAAEIRAELRDQMAARQGLAPLR